LRNHAGRNQASSRTSGETWPRIARCGDQLPLQWASASAEIDTTHFPREGTRHFVQCVLFPPACRVNPASTPFRTASGTFGRQPPPRDGGGLKRRAIFRDDADRADFVVRVAALFKDTGLTVYAWCAPPEPCPPLGPCQNAPVGPRYTELPRCALRDRPARREFVIRGLAKQLTLR
jgi:hypothetical protein